MEKLTVAQQRDTDLTGMGPRFETYLKALIQASVPPEIRGMAEYHLGWKDQQFRDIEGLLGKRGRPMFAMLCYALFNRDYAQLFPVAAAIELLHNCSLVFDDIQDRDTTRRGRPAVWAVWGEDEAINVGAALQTLVWLSLTRAEGALDPAAYTTVERYVPHIMLRQCQGQQMDLAATKSRELLTVEAYLTMISHKTASLFEASGYLGAYCAGGRERAVEVCRELGIAVGLGFQILDDVMGVWGKPEHGLDKPNRDMDHRKKTYPVIVAHGLATEDEQRFIESYYLTRHVNAAMTQDLMAILDRTGARDRTIDLGISYLDQAESLLASIDGDPPVKAWIGDWIRTVAERQLGTL